MINMSDLNLDMHARRLSLDDRFKLCRSIAEECIQDSELRNLLDKKPNIVAYDGFEPSGRMHIAQVRGMRKGVAAHRRRATLVSPAYACHVRHAGRAEGAEREQADAVRRYVQILVRRPCPGCCSCIKCML